MSKLPAIRGEQAIKAFCKAGFEVDRVKGSHHVLKKQGHPFHLSIPVHGKDMGRGLLRKLIKAAGMTESQFIDLL